MTPAARAIAIAAASSAALLAAPPRRRARRTRPAATRRRPARAARTTTPPLPTTTAEAAEDEEAAGAARRTSTTRSSRKRFASCAAWSPGRKPPLTLSGYADVGFFVPQGDGSGFVQDVGPPRCAHFPAVRRPLRLGVPGRHPGAARSTRAASRPISATRPGVDRQDLIDSNGAPGFIVNEVNLTLNARARLQRRSARPASISCPAPGTDFRLGDVVRGRPGVAGMAGRPASGARRSSSASSTP